MNNVKVSLCMCNKTESNEKFMKASGEVQAFNLVQGTACKQLLKQELPKMSKGESLVSQNPGSCKICFHLEQDLTL